MIRSEKIRVATTGIAGSATGESNSSPFQGRILSVQLVPNTSLPATTDTTVFITKDGDENTNVETVAIFTNINTLTKRYPRNEMDDGQGNSINIFEPFVTTKGVHVEVDQCDALVDAVIVEVMYDSGFMG